MNNQIDLFNNEPKKGTTCRSCRFKYKHEYGKMFYCKKQKQKGTAYGDKIIKAGDAACNMYEKQAEEILNETKK